MTSDLHYFAAFGREQLLFDRERNTGFFAPRSRNQKQDPFTQEQREDDPRVEKRARLNNEKQLKRPREESGLISEGDNLIGEKNKLTVQRSVQFELQYQNSSNSMFGMALEIIVAELPRLVEQKQQQEAQIKELKEALDHSKAEIREEKEARVADQGLYFSLLRRYQQELKEALDHAKAEVGEEKEARVAAEKNRIALTEERISLLIEKQQQEAQIKELKEALDHAKAEIKAEKELRVAAEQKRSALTEENNIVLIEKVGWEDEAKMLENEGLNWTTKTAPLIREKDALVRERDSLLDEQLLDQFCTEELDGPFWCVWGAR